MTARRIAITAHALANALGQRSSEVLDKIFSGVSAFGPSSFELSFAVPVGEMHDLPPAHELDSMDDTRILRVALCAARQLRESVSATIQRYGAERVALVVGSCTGGLQQTELAFAELRQGARPAFYDHDRQHPLHRTAEALAGYFGVQGRVLSVSTACSSSALAMDSARRLLRSGLADAVVVAGVDSLCRLTLYGFHALGVLSTSATRPFAADREGITLAEGAAFLLLDAHAESDVYFTGFGCSSDAHHLSAPDPQGRGMLAAMRAALANAGLGRVDHVNAHGTGTPQNDRAESQALRELFGAELPITSTKSSTGHLLGAGGATEAIVAIESLRRQLVPPTIGSTTTDAELGVQVVRSPQPLAMHHVLSNSFGFGGSNASLVFSR